MDGHPQSQVQLQDTNHKGIIMSKKSILQKFQRGGVVLNLEPPGEILEQTLANLLSEYKYRVDSEREEREADKERRFREDIAVREMQMEERLSQADLKQRRDKMRQDEKQSLRDDVTTVLTSDMNLDEQKNLFDSWKLGDLSGEIDRKIGIRDTFSGKIDLLMKSGEATVDDIKKAKMPIMPYAGEDWADTGIARADNYAKNIVANDILDNLYANDDFKRLMGETAIPYDINSAASVLSTIPDMLDVYGKFNKEKVDVIKSMLSSLSEVSKDNPQAALDYYRVFADKLSELTGREKSIVYNLRPNEIQIIKTIYNIIFERDNSNFTSIIFQLNFQKMNSLMI